MAKKDKNSKGKKESKKLVTASPLVDSDNNKVDTSMSEEDDKEEDFTESDLYDSLILKCP